MEDLFDLTDEVEGAGGKDDAPRAGLAAGAGKGSLKGGLDDDLLRERPGQGRDILRLGRPRVRDRRQDDLLSLRGTGAWRPGRRPCPSSSQRQGRARIRKSFRMNDFKACGPGFIVRAVEIKAGTFPDKLEPAFPTGVLDPATIFPLSSGHHMRLRTDRVASATAAFFPWWAPGNSGVNRNVSNPNWYSNWAFAARAPPSIPAAFVASAAHSNETARPPPWPSPG